MNKIQRKRLEKLATILDTADAEHRKNKEPKYDQGAFVHSCGTPACAMGHWAANNKRKWKIVTVGFLAVPQLRLESVGRSVEDAMAEFGLSYSEYSELFSGDGCDNAKTAKQAARYIREFLKRKDAEP